MIVGTVFGLDKVISDHDFSEITLGDCAQLDLLDRHCFPSSPVECTWSTKIV